MSRAERLITIASTATLAALYLENYRKSFGDITRDAIFKKDDSLCQKCLSNTDKSAHHIVPECLENGNNYTEESCAYNRPFLKFYDYVLGTIPKERVRQFRDKIRIKIKSEDNGLTLCHKCHVDLHEHYCGGKNYKINKSDDRPNLPEVFSSKNLITYFCNELINPALREVNVEVIEKDELLDYLKSVNLSD